MPERTPEQIGREAGQASADSIADGLESVLLKLTDAIASLRVEQAEVRDELLDLKQQLDQEAATRVAADKALLGTTLRTREQ